MDIPRGHAAMPLTEEDFLDLIYNYFKAEYAPIRSFWSTATADPRQLQRWINMGHEMSPLVIRPANAQAQKDLESLDYFTRRWDLDANFVRGLVIRFAKYEVHDRLEKKLYECARLDLMVRKALKEKHLIDALWPSPAPRTLSQELLAQGVQVRKWYGDMFNKYFRILHSVDQFELRPEVDQRIKSSGTLMLVPFVDHLIFGAVDPIMPIVAKGAGYSNAKGWKDGPGSSKSAGYGEPGRFEIRFDSSSDAQEKYTKTVVRQCQCNKCGTKRDVQVVISVAPTATGDSATGATTARKASGSNSQSERIDSESTQRYAASYNMPDGREQAPRQPARPQPQPEEAPRPSTPDRKRQCPRCTFLNHPQLTACEMCQADLPGETIQKPPSPAAVRVSHSHSASLAPPFKSTAPADRNLTAERPRGLNRHSLSSTLFSIFPFSQADQQEHHAKLPPTQQPDLSNAPRKQPSNNPPENQQQYSSRNPPALHPPSPAHPPANPSTPPNLLDPNEPTSSLSRTPEMSMMSLTPPPTSSSSKRPAPAGLPSNLMDDFVPVSPGFARDDDEEEDAGWSEMRREGAGGEESSDDEEGNKDARLDLDAVAREEADVWGDREDCLWKVG